MVDYIKELGKFLRAESPLVSFARSIRCEGPGDGTSSGTGAPAAGTGEPGNQQQQQAADQVPEPFKDLDLSELPDDVQAKIGEANKIIADAIKERTAAAQKAEQAANLARTHQSRADKHFEQLRRHNLIGANGEPSVGGNGGGDPANDPHVAILQNLTQTFIGKGFKPEQAKAMAEVQVESYKVMGPDLLRQLTGQLGPVIGAVSDMHANRLYESAKSGEQNAILQIPEVDKLVKENLELMVQNGATIVPDTIANLTNMAYGQYIVKGGKPVQIGNGGGEPTPPAAPPARTTFTTGGSHIPTGGAPVITGQPRTGNRVPVAANADTAQAMAETVAIMNRGLPKKGGR